MKNQIKIRKYADSDYGAFIEMFTEYFRNDFKFDITDETLNSICTSTAQHVGENIQFLDLLVQDGAPKGFILYQVDSPKSDWCEKEGYGMIREVFIKPELRKRGFGKLLANHAEEHLYTQAVQHIYLTSDEAGDFWHSIGYRESGEICAKNHLPIYVKCR